jgi:hypothetical protein
VDRLRSRDPTFECIDLYGKQHTDEELAELIDCLLAHPDVVTHVYLGSNQLTDNTGVKIARYIVASSTIEWLGMGHNQFGSSTYLAIASALRFNSSLQFLSLNGNQEIDIEGQTRIDAAFINALILNPVRPFKSVWYLFEYSNDLKRLRPAAERIGHPSMQAMLSTHLLRSELTA